MPARLGPGGWPCHSILGWGAPMVFMGDVAGGSAIVPRREGGPAHTIFRLRAKGLPTLLYRSLLGERMLPNKVASAKGIHAMPAGVVGGGADTPTLV